jgi:hypothetical protein
MDGRSEACTETSISHVFTTVSKALVKYYFPVIRTLMANSFSVYHHDENSVLYVVHDKLWGVAMVDHELNALDTNFRK